MQFETTIGESVFDILLNPEKSDATVNEHPVDFEILQNDETQLLFRSGHRLYKVNNMTVDGGSVECTVNGKWIQADLKDEQQQLLERMGFKAFAEKSVGELQAPMPGKILELMISEGDEVELGDPVAILEAMKMENELKAPCSGTISSVSVTTGTNVEKNQLLLEIEPRG